MTKINLIQNEQTKENKGLEIRNSIVFGQQM
jgi:hypothetical protein